MGSMNLSAQVVPPSRVLALSQKVHSAAVSFTVAVQALDWEELQRIGVEMVELKFVSAQAKTSSMPRASLGKRLHRVPPRRE